MSGECGSQCARPELAAEEQHGEDEQGHIEDVAEGSDLDGREEIVQHDAATVDTAGHDVVGIDKEHKARGHDGAPQEDG